MFIKVGDVIELKDKESRYGKLVVRSVINPDTQFTTLACEDEHGDWLWLNLDEVEKHPIGVKLVGSNCPENLTLGKVYKSIFPSNFSSNASIMNNCGWDLFILVGKDSGCAHLEDYDCYWEWVYSNEDVVDSIVSYSHTHTLNTGEPSYTGLEGMVVNEQGGMKADGTKPRPSILLQDLGNATQAVIRVLEYGAKKYNRANYSKVEADRYYDAIGRHYMAYLAGEKTDPETGESHMAHIACCALFLIEKDLKGE